MKKLLILSIALISIVTNAQKSESPYEWDWTRDGIWTGAALGGTVTGFLLIQNKDDLEPDEFARIENDLQGAIDDINGIDRWAAGNNNESANKISDIPFAMSFAAPFVMLFDDEINDHTGQYVGLYIESLATTAAMYTITAGLVDRSRPYVYDDSGVTGRDRRMSNNGQRSFYSGHVAAAATATFFTAKAYADFNPDSPAKFWVWTELHKKKNTDGLSFYPTGGRTYLGDEYTAMAVSLKF